MFERLLLLHLLRLLVVVVVVVLPCALCWSPLLCSLSFSTGLLFSGILSTRLRSSAQGSQTLHHFEESGGT